MYILLAMCVCIYIYIYYIHYMHTRTLHAHIYIYSFWGLSCVNVSYSPFNQCNTANYTAVRGLVHISSILSLSNISSILSNIPSIFAGVFLG